MLAQDEKEEMLDQLQVIVGACALEEEEKRALVVFLREWLDSCITAASIVSYGRGQSSVLDMTGRAR